MEAALRCGYASKPCRNPRAVKPSGERHKLCEEHRQLANRYQRRLDAPRLGERVRGADAVSARRSPVSPVAPAESQLRAISPADGFRLRSSGSTPAASAGPSASASQSQPKTVKVSQVLAQMQRDVAGERTTKRPRRSDGADAGGDQGSGIDTPPSKTAEPALPTDDALKTEAETEMEPVPVDDSTPCVAISSRQWFPTNKRKRVCAVCRYETRKATVVTDFCRAHGVSLCSRVYPSAAAGPGMCPDTRWTCWTKFHRFYQPAGVFSAKGNVRRSSPLVKLRYAYLRSQGQAVDDELDDEQE